MTLFEESDISVLIRVLPKGDEFDVELPRYATGQEIIEAFLDQGAAPRGQGGDEYEYQLVAKELSREIQPWETLYETEVQNGKTLLLSPKLVAGGWLADKKSGELALFIPKVIEVGKTEEVSIVIFKDDLKRYLLKNKGVTTSEINRIEIRKVMRVTLQENSVKKGLEIRNKTEPDQIITDKFFTEWRFGITPTRIGLASILLNISLVENVKNIGIKSKTVFLFEQEINVSRKEGVDFGGWYKYKNINAFSTWNEEQNRIIIDHISKNETGRALSTLANHFQKNKELHSAVILLKAQYYHGKNMANLNLIEQAKWWMIQSRINYSILQLVNDIDEGRINEKYSFPDYSGINEILKKLI